MLYLFSMLHQRGQSILISNKPSKVKLICKNKCFIKSKVDKDARKIVMMQKIKLDFKRDGYFYKIIYEKKKLPNHHNLQ